MQIWSTEDGGGDLVIEWDFAHPTIQTFKSFCAAGTCLYSTIQIGFITTTPPHDAYHEVADGTSISMAIVDIDPAVTVQINGVPLHAPLDQTLLGQAPTLHTHPSWQLSLPTGVQGDFPLSFKLTTDSPAYRESSVYQIVLTNLPTPTPNAPTPTGTPTPTPTPEIPACVGDCDGDGTVTVDELIMAVISALHSDVRCRACDRNGDGVIDMGELVSAINASLTGCPAVPTPTATAAAMLEDIQRTIFSPRCTIPTCHTADGKAGNLVLEAGESYAQLVGVPPDVFTAREAGLLRVDPGHPELSFLLVKLEGPPPDQGNRMPLGMPALADTEIQLIRDWIAQGAKP